jgi:cell division inhibitor SepF
LEERSSERAVDERRHREDIMEETIIDEKPGFFSRLTGVFTRHEDYDETEEPTTTTSSLTIKGAYRYTVTVRRQIVSFDDAMAAAGGLKRGEQQILNLASTEPVLRQKVVDFMCGVNFAHEGTWEEIGENIYLIVPASAYVEVAPATPRMNAARN